MLIKAIAMFSLAALLVLQDTGLLRIRVALPDAGGAMTPMARVVLLISDNPSTGEPRRVRTGPDGTVEIALKPGLYTIESDEPTMSAGARYAWTQMLTVVAGQTIALELGAANADADGTASPTGFDTAALLASWRDSVVEIWTPTTHAAGFLVDSKGVIATTDRALGGHGAVEVEFVNRAERFKVAGRVLSADHLTGAAFVWVNPQAVAGLKPLDLRCGATLRPEVNNLDQIVTIGASVLMAKELSDGRVTKVTPQAVFSTMRIGDDTAGGPVFTESGELLGISSVDDPGDRRRWNDAWVVPLNPACAQLVAATAAMTGPPPVDRRLPIDPPRTKVSDVTALAKPAPAKSQPPVIVKSSDFDITLLTPQQARDTRPSMTSIRTDFGAWTQYVQDAPPVLLVRISPQFEEAMWKTLARGYAFLQGVWLGPFKSFTANFLRMRAYCGKTEVLPIHPFVIEHPIPERTPIREGLYVFERSAFGPHCQSVRFSMYSEKSPENADTREIDPKLFEQLATSGLE